MPNQQICFSETMAELLVMKVYHVKAVLKNPDLKKNANIFSLLCGIYRYFLAIDAFPMQVHSSRYIFNTD